jgi:hypothetical protein
MARRLLQRGDEVQLGGSRAAAADVFTSAAH